jgi:hypothetical protein
MTAKKAPQAAPSDSLDWETKKKISALVKTKVQQDNAIRTRVDPHLKNPRLSLLVGKLLFSEFPENGEDYAALASHLIYHIKRDGDKELGKMFAAIRRMKTHAAQAQAKKPSRYAVATQVLKRFLKIQSDDSWTAHDFHIYLKRETKDMEGIGFPPLNKAGSWTSINKRLLINHKVTRTGKPKAGKSGKTTT